MSNEWLVIYQGGIQGHPVSIEKYYEGGYRVVTAQLQDDISNVSADDGPYVIMPPWEKGSRIDFEGNTAAEIRADLIASGFPEEFAAEVSNHIK